MSDDLVKRLRESGTAGKIGGLGLLDIASLFADAADRIEALEAALLMVRSNYPMVRRDEDAVDRALEGSHD